MSEYLWDEYEGLPVMWANGERVRRDEIRGAYATVMQETPSGVAMVVVALAPVVDAPQQ